MLNQRIFFKIFAIAVIGAIIAFYIKGSRHRAPLIPIEILFAEPDMAKPTISYDGNYIAYLKADNAILNIWVKDLATNQDRQVTHEKARSIRSYAWGPDSNRFLYLKDDNGDENWHLYGVNLQTNNIQDYTPFSNVQARFIADNPEKPGSILIGLNKDDPANHDVYKLELETGHLRMVEKNPGNIVGWYADDNLNIRLAYKMEPDNARTLLIKKDNIWKPLIVWSDEESGSHPLDFSKDGKYLYLLDSRNNNTARLVKLDLKSGDVQILASNMHYDISSALIHPRDNILQGYYVTGAKPQFFAFDDNIKSDLDIISKKYKNTYPLIISRDYADKKWIIAFLTDSGPTAYAVYTRDKQKLDFLFYNKKSLLDYTLSPMQPIAIIARDGLKLEGYLTLPYSYRHGKLPLVLLVHGGPWARDGWGYNSEVQWLANRGYAVLQVNYRGSTGYGKKFVLAGDKQWGGKMLDDVVDAATWAVSQGIADSNKIAIYGGSYGGYAALCGAAMTNMFCCSVDFCGISSLQTYINSIPPYWKAFTHTLYKRIGNPHTELDFLKQRSPLTHVDKIKIPIFIAQGAKDPRVKKEESEAIVHALKAKNIPHEYMFFDDEGHGFVKEKNRLAFYKAVEKFLADNI